MNDMTPRTIHRFEPRGRQTRHCKEIGCSKATREGKPYCTRHVDSHAYVKAILIVLNEREQEMQRVFMKGHRQVNINGSVAKDIIDFLSVHGKRTIKRLARDLNIGAPIMASYIKALKGKGIVSTGETSRGYFTVCITS